MLNMATVIKSAVEPSIGLCTVTRRASTGSAFSLLLQKDCFKNSRFPNLPFSQLCHSVPLFHGAIP